MIIENSRVIRRYKSGYEIREEFWKTDPNDEGHIMRQAYTPSGDYIGDSKFAHRLCTKRGIKPEKSDPAHCVCSIGFSESEQKWYGWSHRAIYGFGIGSVCEKGHIHYRPATPQELYDELITPDESGWAWQKPEDVEIIENGVRIRQGYYNSCDCDPCNCKKEEVDTVKVGIAPEEETYEVVACACDCKQTCEPRIPREPDGYHYFEIECGRGEWTAKTLDDAKQMAIDFAEGVA